MTRELNKESLNVALLEAAENGNAETVKTLIDAGADLNTAMNSGTPLFIACYNGHTATVELLLKQANIGINQAETQYGWTPLYTACYNGHTATVELLLTKNANINQAINYKYFFAGQTPLYIACYNGHTATVELLLQKENIQVDKANKYGKTPLLIAAQSRHHDIVKILFDNGANPKVFIKPGIFKNSFIPQYENFSDDVKKIIKEICTDKAIEHRDEKLKIQRTIKNQLNVIKEQDKEDLKKSLNDYLDGYNDNWRDNYISLKLFSSHHTDYKLSSLTKEDLDQLFENKTFKSILLLNYADSIKDKFAIIGDKEEIFKIVKAQHDISDDDEKQYQEYKAKVVNTKDIDNIIKYALDVLKINKSVNSEEPQKTFTERYSSNSERRYSIREAQRDAAEMDGLFNEKGCSIS
jgi:ankyrin repeat protein